MPIIIFPKIYSTKMWPIKTIFILGMPRSGTSLVEQIISSHDKVFGGGELIYMSQIINEKFLNNLDSLQDIDKLLTEAQKDYISKISNFNDKLYSFTDKSPLNFRWVGFILNMLLKWSIDLFR